MTPLRQSQLATRAMSGDQVARQSLREAGIPCESLLELHHAQRDAFNRMSSLERAHDYDQTEAQLEEEGA